MSYVIVVDLELFIWIAQLTQYVRACWSFTRGRISTFGSLKMSIVHLIHWFRFFFSSSIVAMKTSPLDSFENVLKWECPEGLILCFLRRSNNRILNGKVNCFDREWQVLWGHRIRGLTSTLMIKCITFIACVGSSLFTGISEQSCAFPELVCRFNASMPSRMSIAWISRWPVCYLLIYACAAQLWRCETSVCFVSLCLGVSFL